MIAVSMVVVKATAILALALIAARVERRSRASKRHAILTAAFGALAALPVACALAPAVRIALPAAAPERIEESGPVARVAAAQPAAGPQEVAGATIARSYEIPVATLFFGVWLIGTAVCLTPVMIGLWQTRAVRRAGQRWDRGQKVANGLAVEAGIRRPIQALTHESLDGPFTSGLWRPAIVFSADAREWEEDDLKRAMAHELEHVRRGDWTWHCVARAICSLYWFHPLAWMAWRQLTVEAERACDDAALRGWEATAYAAQLVGLARRMSAARRSPAPAMASRSELSTRVGAVLDARQERGRPGVKLVAFACAAAAALTAAISPLTMAAGPQRFEVASVRLEDPRDPHSSPEYTNSPEFRTVSTVFPSNRLTIRHTSLQSLISDAYTVEFRNVVGGPNWLDQQRYNLTAKVEGNARLTREQMRPLMRTLLEERFHLKAHRGRKLVPGYALVVAKRGPRLQPNKGAPFMGSEGGYTIQWQNVSVEHFARMLQNPARRPVIDRTGIKGMYDFELKFGPHGIASEDPVFSKIPESYYANLPDIFTALEEKFGLKLVPEKIAIDTLVIEHVEKVPTEN